MEDDGEKSSFVIGIIENRAKEVSLILSAILTKSSTNFYFNHLQFTIFSVVDYEILGFDKNQFWTLWRSHYLHMFDRRFNFQESFNRNLSKILTVKWMHATAIVRIYS